ncbi:MAG TPA: methyl-accepting chemotaxis protein, partial [Acidobacteriaceae bacterium]
MISTIDTTAESSLVRRLHTEADQVMVAVLCLLWIVSFGFVFLYGTWLLWGLLATAISGLGTILYRQAPAALSTRISMGFCFMAYSALLIQQAHGLVETHFGIFALLAFLLYYRDWRPIVVAAAVIAIHHLGFYLLQVQGVPVYVFQHTHMPVMVLVHAAYVVFESLILVLMATKLHQETLEAAALASLGDENTRSDEGDPDIDLDSRRVQSAGVAGHSVGLFLDTISHALREASLVAVAIRQASHDLRTAGSGMVTIRDQQQSDVEHVVELIHNMDNVASRVAGSSQAIAQEAGQAAHAAQQTGESMALAAQSIDSLVQAVEETARQMTHLEESTAHIEKIVSVINEIAGQTNLLALNASIEAARAGEAGRGFAVVAGEVRRLSENTQNSARQIQEVVSTLRSAALSARQVAEASQSEAIRGSERMQHASGELQSIVERLPQFSAGMDALSAEMHSQKRLMQQIANHMAKISSFLQQSSGRVENISSSGQSLEQMSERLYA